jgi:hypothetical protein
MMAKGVVIRKHNKPNYKDSKTYRIIDLLNCIRKVIKKVITVLVIAIID